MVPDGATAGEAATAFSLHSHSVGLSLAYAVGDGESLLGCVVQGGTSPFCPRGVSEAPRPEEEGIESSDKPFGERRQGALP